MTEALATGERRILTIVVLDIVGSTVLSSSLDPEDFSDILQGMGTLWTAAIGRYDGRIMKWTGDGFIAVFGYPRAHDNDGVRAVHAGLEILAAHARERASGSVTPDVRIGVHTGLTLVTPGGEGFDVVGDTPAIATRIEALAKPNTLLVSGATASRVEHEFELNPLGGHPLKGIPGVIDVFGVLRPSDDPESRGPNRLVGRDEELRRLVSSWSRALDGQCRAAVVRAPPGFGKTRLIEELCAQVRPAGSVLVFRCSELMQTTALFPILRGLRAMVGRTPDADAEAVLDRIDAEFGQVDVPAAPALIATLLGLDPRHEADLPVEPARRRARQLEVLVAWLVRQAEDRPCCVVLEDLHWTDPTTVELVRLFLASATMSPVLLVMSTRNGASDAIVDLGEGFEQGDEVDVMDLQPLSNTSASELIDEVAGGAVPDELRVQLLDRSDAIPLYLQELTRAVASPELLVRGETGLELRGPLLEADVPLSLSDSLMSRLDALGPSRTLALVAATIGRTFSRDLLVKVTREQGTLDDDLAVMVRAGLFTRHSSPNGQHDYTFSHALIRDAAYASLTRKTRLELHRRVAAALVEQGGASEPALLAYHYTKAGQLPSAIEWWTAAGRANFAAAHYDESIASFQRGLTLMKDLADADADADAWRLEFPLQLGIGQSLATRFGYQSADAEAAYQRANELAAGLEAVEAVPALLGLWQYYEVRSDPTRRRALATRSHELASLTDDPAIRLEGISALSTTLAFEGEFAEACTLIDRGLVIFDEHGDQPMEFHMPQHPVAGFCGVSGPLLWMSGDFVAAQQRYERLQEFALQSTGRLGPFTAGYARVFSAWFSSLLGDFSAMAAHATSAMDIGAEHGFVVWLGAGYIQLGIATALLGDTATGIAMTSDGIDAWGAAGSGLMGSYYRFWLGLAYEVAGDPEASLRVVHEGIAHSEAHRERVQSALLHRSRGRLLERMGRPAEASAARRLAVRIAAEQGARFCELLALHDLARVGDAVDEERHRLEELIGDLSAEDLGARAVASAIDDKWISPGGAGE